MRIGGLDLIVERDALLPVALKPLLSSESTSAWCCARWPRAATRRSSLLPSSIRRCSARLLGEQPMIELANPIAADMAVMRSSLWPGLLGVARENLRRQHPRVRLFEIANRFLWTAEGRFREQKSLAAHGAGRPPAGAVGQRRRRRWISTTSRPTSRRF